VRILLVDNYDSFTYNLVHYMEAEGARVEVVRNDELLQVDSIGYDRVVLSPGPGLPAESGELMTFIPRVVGKQPILGVCLGMQAIALHFGGELYNLSNVRHGIGIESSLDTSSALFKGMPQKTEVGLYHSWAVKEPLPQGFKRTARNSDNVVMAMEHCTLPVFAVQFHPESVLTPLGRSMIRNFLKS
jgi:anthranilate synthase component II